MVVIVDNVMNSLAKHTQTETMRIRELVDNSFRKARKSTRCLRYQVMGAFSECARFRRRMLEEEKEWRRHGYNYRDIVRDSWVISATNSVYIAVSKAANTTMKHLIAEHAPSDSFLNGLKDQIHSELASDDTLIHFYVPEGMMRLQDCRLTPNDLAEGTQRCFTVVRHPVDRFVSAWCDKVNSSRATPLKTKLGEFLRQKETFQFSIDDLIAYVEETPSEDMDKHVRPQWACCGAGRISMEMVGKVENLEQDIRSMMEAGLVSESSVGRLKVRNATVRSHRHDLTVSQQRKISKLYTRDFELFEY